MTFRQHNYGPAAFWYTMANAMANDPLTTWAKGRDVTINQYLVLLRNRNGYVQLGDARGVSWEDAATSAYDKYKNLEILGVSTNVAALDRGNLAFYAIDAKVEVKITAGDPLQGTV